MLIIMNILILASGLAQPADQPTFPAAYSTTQSAFDTFPCLGVNTHWSSAMIYSTAFPFKNLFKLSEPFSMRNPDVPLDAQGYPTAIPGESARVVVSGSDYLPNGNYTLHWEGVGEFEIRTYEGTFRFDENAASPQTIPMNFYGEESRIELIIYDVEPGNHLRNLRLYLPGYDDTGSLLTDHYKEFIRPFGVLRPVWWSGTILFEDVVFDEWAERPQVSDFTWGVFDGSFGVPYEVMIDLCNETDTHLWITIPHTATDDFMANAANLIEERLRPDLNVWVEFSNEAWNWDYQVDAWLNEEVERLRMEPDIRAHYREPDGTIDFWDASAYGYHTARLLQIFEDNFTDNARVIGILAGQSGYDVPLGLAITEVERQGKMHLVDAFSIAGYFSFPEESTVNANDLNAVENAMRDAIDELYEPDSWDGEDLYAPALHNLRQFQWATERGKRMVAYEGGQHVTTYSPYGGAFLNNEQVTTINRDPMLYDLYRYLLAKWDALGGATFVHFADIYAYGPEAFGLKEYWNQPDNENYKWQALQDHCMSATVSTEEACRACAFDEVFIAPNPASSILTISNLPNNARISISDVQGRRLRQVRATNAMLELDISDLPNGLYFLTIFDERHGAFHTEKIIKHH